jgi:hypothetical protein
MGLDLRGNYGETPEADAWGSAGRRHGTRLLKAVQAPGGESGIIGKISMVN